jgi:hypothetical protein
MVGADPSVAEIVIHPGGCRPVAAPETRRQEGTAGRRAAMFDRGGREMVPPNHREIGSAAVAPGRGDTSWSPRLMCFDPRDGSMLSAVSSRRGAFRLRRLLCLCGEPRTLPAPRRTRSGAGAGAGGGARHRIGRGHGIGRCRWRFGESPSPPIPSCPSSCLRVFVAATVRRLLCLCGEPRTLPALRRTRPGAGAGAGGGASHRIGRGYGIGRCRWRFGGSPAPLIPSCPPSCLRVFGVATVRRLLCPSGEPRTLPALRRTRPGAGAGGGAWHRIASDPGAGGQAYSSRNRSSSRSAASEGPRPEMMRS